MSWFQRSPPNPLRVACEKIVKGCKNVAYFPSYEIVTGGFGKTSYFAEDCRSVTEEGVAHVMAFSCATMSAIPVHCAYKRSA